MFKQLLRATFFSPLLVFAALSPNPPVPFSFNSSVGSFVTVAGNSQGHLAIWTCVYDGGPIYWNFSSDNGLTWVNYPAAALNINRSAISGPWIAANEAGFAIVWTENPPGATGAHIFSSFSADNGETWSDPVAIVDLPLGFVPTITSTDSGFLTTWYERNDSFIITSVHSSFSSNGINWSSPTTIDLDDTNTPTAQPIVTGVDNSFMVTWPSSTGNAYSSFSSDDGTNWSAKSTIINDIVDGFSVWPAQTSDGFMAVWQNGSGNAYSSFSSNNGDTWGLPNLISNNIITTNDLYDDVSVIGTDNGFIVAAHFEDGTGQVSISSDFGVTWDPFVPFTGENLMSTSIYNCFADIALGTDGFMVVWPDSAPNAISAFISFSPSILPVAYLTGSTAFNQFPFQSQYYNALSWQPSPSDNVTGYSIYKNGVFLTSTSMLNFIDPSIEKNSTYTYEVFAKTASGSQSSGVSVTVTTPN